MYEYIKGILTKITAKYIVVETAGIGYLLHVLRCAFKQSAASYPPRPSPAKYFRRL